MIIKFLKEKRKIFISLLFSYITIILVSLLISAVAYIQSVRVIQTVTTQSQNAMLEQLQQTVDTKLNDIERIMNIIVLDKNINAQCSLVNPIEPIYRLPMLGVINTIATCKITNSYIKGIFIYIPNRDMIVSDKGTSGSMEYFDIYYPGKIHDKVAWMNFLKQGHVKEFCPMSSINTGKPNMDGILFLQSIPYNSDGHSDATVGIILDSAFLNNSLSSFNEISEANSIILNNKNEIVASLNKQINFNISDFKLENNQGVTNVKIGNSHVVLSYIKSQSTDWKYINIIPKSAFTRKAKDVIFVMLLCTLLCLIGGTIVALVFARKNYNPINNIIEMFSKTGKLKFDSSINEFKLIENSMLNIIDENKNITKTLENQKSTLKESFLNRLVMGSIKNNISIDDICSTYDIYFKEEDFVLIAFCLKDVGKIHTSKYSQSEDKSIELAQFIIRNVMEELVKQKHNCIFFEIDQIIVCIANIEKTYDTTNNMQNEIKNILVSGKKFIMDKYGILLTASVSNLHSTVSGIPEAYKECLELAEYKIVVGNNDIILYSEICLPISDSFMNTYPIEVQQQFINCIRCGDFTNAKQVMEQIFENNFLNSNNSLDMTRCLMFAIINTMINALTDINIICDSNFIERLNPFRMLIKCETITSMKQQVMDILLKIEQYHNERKNENSSNKIREIITYIENHYNDTNLSLTSIASELGMNSIYISRFFKSQTGEGILFTINNIRLEKSKSLIIDTKINIKDIAEMVGFINSTVFIRTFKKYEGITPGKYRELDNGKDKS